MANTNDLQQFLEQKHPELLFIIDEFNQFLSDAEADKALKEKLALAEAKNTKKWYNYGFKFQVEYGYKGFTDYVETESICFDQALAIMSKFEWCTKLIVYKDPNADGMSFDEMAYELLAGEQDEDERDVKKVLKELLFGESPSCIYYYLTDTYFDESRVKDPFVSWSGQKIWSEDDFEKIWEEFKTFKFKLEDED